MITPEASDSAARAEAGERTLAPNVSLVATTLLIRSRGGAHPLGFSSFVPSPGKAPRPVDAACPYMCRWLIAPCAAVVAISAWSIPP